VIDNPDPTNSGTVDRYARGIPSRFEMLATTLRSVVALVEVATYRLVALVDERAGDQQIGEVIAQLQGIRSDLSRLIEEHRMDLEREHLRRRALRPGADDPRRPFGAAYRIPIKVLARTLGRRAKWLFAGAWVFTFGGTFALTVAALPWAAFGCLVAALLCAEAGWRVTTRQFVAIEEETTDAIFGEEHEQ